MRSSLQNYHTKILIFVLALVFLTVLATTVSVNIFVSSQKDKLQKAIAEKFNQRISIKKVGFRLPNRIVLKDVKVLNDPDTENKLFSIQRIEAKLSLGKLLKKKVIHVTDVSVYGIKLDYLEAVNFLSENFSEIIKLLNTLPSVERFGIYLRQARLNLPQESGKPSYIGFDIDLQTVKDKFLSKGTVYLKHPFFKKTHLFGFGSKDDHLNYIFKGYITKSGIAIENFGLKHKKGDLKLWGAFEDNILRLNGFTTLYNFFSPSVEENLPILSFVEKIKSLFRKLKVPSAIIGSPSSDLVIYDLGCLVKFYFPKIEINNISFSVKNVPIGVKGSISFLDSPVVDLKISSFPNQVSVLREKNPKCYSLGVKGLLRDEAFSGAVDVEFTRQKPVGESLDRLSVIVKKATLMPLEGRKFDAHLKAAKVAYETPTSQHVLLFDDTQILFDFSDKRFKGFEINSGIYDGTLEGNGYVDVWTFPFEAVLNVLVRDVTPKKLESILSYFANIEGKLASRINYQNKPDRKIAGQLLIRDGYLHDFDFFNWLASFFEIPSLATMDFDVLTADFAVDAEVSKLENIKANHKGVSLSGYFKLFANDLVASKLSLGLSREILQKSPKFKSLLNLLGQGFDNLSFDFQLSGLFNDLNFKWLESEFKDKLKEKIPDFIERGIERKIETIIKSTPK